MSLKLEFHFAQSKPWVCTAKDTLSIGLVNPLIDGDGTEVWHFPSGDTEQGSFTSLGGLSVWQSNDLVCGGAVVPVDGHAMRATTFELYKKILMLCEGKTLHRCWNFVPQINAPVGELDRYMCFSVGRAEAFEQSQQTQLPPASAVGTYGECLAVVFVAGSETLAAVENPLQVPAYEYPSRYGPKAPSFARAGLIASQSALYISGTASIRASESQHLDDPVAQTELSIDNLRKVSTAAGMPDGLMPADPNLRTARVYVRHPQQWPLMAATVEAQLFGGHAPQATQQFNVIEAPICREELLVEIEAFVQTNPEHE